MRAVIQTGYGSQGGLRLDDIPKPRVDDDSVLVRVRAAALQVGDWFILRGKPYPVRFVAGWPKPRNYVPGFDLAGHVEAVGSKVTRFRPGDEVIAACGRACGEYASAAESAFEHKPPRLTLEQAAALPSSGVVALQGLRDVGKLHAGHKVLINGASGGVGTFAVQIAKAFGAEVTGVCSTRNVDMVRSLGADHVIDYTREDFTRKGESYDVILDNVANHSLSACRRALTPTGIHVPNSGHAGLGYALGAFVQSALTRRQGRPFLAKPNPEDLVALSELVEGGKLTPVVDKTYRLDEISSAMDYIAEGHARGKVVISI